MIARLYPEGGAGAALDDADGHLGPEGVAPVLLDEALFTSALIRERKRSDRSGRPFVLLLMRAGDERSGGSSSTVVAAVAAAAADAAAVAGWTGEGSLVGVIAPLPGNGELSRTAADIEGRVRQELARRVDAATAAPMTLRLHVYPVPPGADATGSEPADSVFHPEWRRPAPRRVRYEASKRGLDIMVSLTLLLALSPLLALIAGLVKLGSRGPVLFRQVRIGHRMKPFTMLKFRTMETNADHAIHREFVSAFIKGGGELHQSGRTGFFKLVDDPRVTPIGRLLRRTSLDELPQLWNVLRGDMSLVGPRPPLRYELEDYAPWHRGRLLDARPGITGLWQVTGRSRTTFDEMVRLDLRYGRTRSLWTDLKILLATPAAVLSGKGAC